MKKIFIYLFIVTSFAIKNFAQKPIETSKINKNYFTYKDKTIALVTSAEHYGSVLNTAFDYITYLNSLKKNNLNYTRIFTGAYVEKPGAFEIVDNTLAPDSNHFLSPWARTNMPGYYLGGNKFNLDQWDPQYFKRLHNFIQEAAKRDIIVEITLFSSMYWADGWLGSPLNKNNNINHADSIILNNVNTLYSKKINEYQAKMVSKIVQELNQYSNIFYEIQNEPWSDNNINLNKTIDQFDKYKFNNWQIKLEIPNKNSSDWHKFIAQTIVDAEKTLSKKHMIAHNYANFYGDLTTADISNHVSLVNFHYALPTSARDNQNTKYTLGFDESGFTGTGDTAYVRQAYRWLLSGGGLFNNLDYSFTSKLPQGTNIPNAPGGGGISYRDKLGFLKAQLEKLDLNTSKPSLEHKAQERFYLLLDNKNNGLAFWEEDSVPQKKINLLPGQYLIQWYIPHNPAEKPQSNSLKVIAGQSITFTKPISNIDYLLKITRKK